MGGVCKLKGKITRDIKEGPSCTDNFQILENKFKYDGQEWHSAEQAYQASKFDRGSDRYLKILSASPDNQIDWEYGEHVWKLGQLGEIKEDWDDIKIKNMLLINMHKFAGNKELQEDLLSTKGYRIEGAPSTWEWQKWNGLIMSSIRNHIQQDRHFETTGGLERRIEHLSTKSQIEIMKILESFE